MKRILAIDYGTTHVGLAISEGWLAEPMPAISAISDETKLKLLLPILTQHAIDLIIIGITSGKIHHRIKAFAEELALISKLPIQFIEEDHTSIIATHHAKESGKKIKKLGTKEHSLAACVILQEYLDTTSKG